MIKAVIFDCFGVLATEAWLPFKARHFGHDPSLLEQATDLGNQANRGLISYSECLSLVAELAGITQAQAQAEIARNVPNELLFAYLRELKPHYKLGFLSNIAADHLHRIFTEDQLSIFDAVTLSYKNGFIKPQPEAYDSAAQDLGLELEECILVDDQERNVTGARDAGMQAVLYRDTKQFRSELEELLANPKS